MRDWETVMTEKKNKEFTTLIIFNVILLIIFGIMLLIGTWNDKSISETIYRDDNILSKIVTCFGTFPFFFSGVIFLGVLYEKAIHSSVEKPLKTVLCAVCIILGIFVGFIGSGSIVDKDTLGQFFPSLNRNIPVISGISLVTIFPLFYAGYRLGGKTQDKLIVKRIISLLVLLGLSYAFLQIFKGVFHRPRFRLALLGYQGIGFQPWYKPFEGAARYMERFGIESSEFRSFPSGHSILSMSVVYVLQSFSWLFPKLRSEKLGLGITGAIFAVMIMLTRVVLGAHYVSDVSAGAIVGGGLALAYTVIQHNFDKKCDCLE